ncbi:FG-GAP-like repeat-containing protein [Arthrobacter sp. PL16]|uniref:FG-GAP-like repeat-containing protein n=1 Tax=Arthrobacter sp. PL16 TaxID=3071720 RepID=UPI002E1118AE
MSVDYIGSAIAGVTVRPAASAVVVPVDKSLKVFSPGDFNGDGRADMVTRRTDGTLWLHPGFGNGSFGAAVKIGSGFEVYNQFIGIGDYDGDRRNDFLARNVDGSLWRYSGTGTISSTNEGYRMAVKIGDGGWDGFNTIIGAGDADGNGRPDLLARKPDGSLWLYSGPGDGTHGYARQVGSGSSNSLELSAVGDFNGDGPVDLMSRSPQGELRLMVGNGSGAFTPTGFTIGSGWNIYSTVIGNRDFNTDGRSDLMAIQPDQTLRFYAGTGTASEGYLRPTQTTTSFWPSNSTTTATADLNSDGRRDVLTRRPDGTLWFHPGQGQASFTAARRIGSGWNIYQDITAASDFNADGRNDILARTPNGDLYLYPGTGTISATNEGYSAPRKIGTGWNVFTDITGGTDLTGDGKPDILARHQDGSLWRYDGTGRIGTGNEGYQPGTIIGLSGWDAFTDITPIGDYDRNGTTDLLVRNPNGDLGLYRGNNSTFPTQEIVGTGWNVYTKLLPLGDQNADTLSDITTTTPTGTTWLYPGDGMTNEGYNHALTTGRL